MVYDVGTLAACAALGSLLPDLDASQSKIKHLRVPNTKFKPFLLPAYVVHRSDQHRGLLHSLWGVGMATRDQHRGLLHSLWGVGMATLIIAPVALWMGWAPVAALLLGYASHLLGDSATKSGLRLRYPNPMRYHLLPKGWRITTGTLAEELVLVSAAMTSVLLLINQLPSAQ